MKQFLILCLFLSIKSAFASNELTLYFIPSSLGMDWSTPQTLIWSSLKNRLSLRPRFMGHVFVEMKCGDRQELTGMTGARFDYLNQILIQQRGFGVFYHSFEGTLEEKEKILPELNEYLKTGHANFTRFLLNGGQCQRMVKYFDDYKKKNVGRHYGLANRPRYGEGAGCSAFGASFPDVLGVLDQEMRESWSHSVLIPMEYVGPPLQDETVSFFKIFFKARNWAHHKEKHVALSFWDPDRMHRWVKEKFMKKQADYSPLVIGKAQGVVVDKRHIPVVDSPIWLQHTDPLYRGR